MKKVILFLFLAGSLHSFHLTALQPLDEIPLGTVEDIVFSSPRVAENFYGAPKDEFLSAPSQAVNSYLPPLDPVEPAASAPSSSYGFPRDSPLSSESVQIISIQEPQVNAPVSSYGSPRASVITSEPLSAPSQAVNSYLLPADPVRPAASAPISYGFPRDGPLSSESVQTVSIQEAPVSSYGFPRDSVLTSASVPALSRKAAHSSRTLLLSSPSQTISTFASPKAVSRVKTKVADPIDILTYSNTGPQDGNYQYAFETENGIKQSVTGEMKVVGEEQVYTMSGSYSYPGSDGQLYVVDWYADETGYHPSAPHLPKSVLPNHPEVAAAVRAQLLAAEQEEAAAASKNSLVILAPPQTSFGDSLAGYGDNTVASTELLDSYGLPGYSQ